MTPFNLRIYSAALLLLVAADRLLSQDCNGNGLDDAAELTAGEAQDCNFNGVPDACEGPGFGFPEAVELELESTTRSAVSADFNGDDIQDLAVGYFGGVAIRFGERVGDFADFLEVTSPVATSNPLTWGAGDLDADGDIDLAVLEPTRLVVVYNVGDGTFEDGPTMDLTGRLIEFAIGDLTGDGSADVVVTDARNDLAKVIMTGSGGTLAEPVDYPVGDDPRDVAIGEVDGELGLDIVVVNRLSANVSVLFNDGAGGFADSTTVDGAGLQPQRLIVADFSNDGLADLATGDRVEVTVRLNEGGRTFSPPVALVVALGVNVVSMGAADFDGDGDVDIVTSYAQPPSSVGFANSGTGAFNMGFPLGRPSFARMVGHDADVDGATDLILVPSQGNTVTVLWNRQRQIAVPFEAPRTYDTNEPHTADIGDVDGDGDLDIALGHNSFRAMSVMINDGAGAFLEDRTIGTPSGGGAFSIELGDIDNDGDLDIIAGSFDRSGVFLYENIDGNGTFEFTKNITVSSPFHVTSADVDGNSTLDVIVSSQSLNAIDVVFNDGNGFSEDNVRVDRYSAGTAPRAAAAVDLDNDGDIDLAVANIASSNVSIFEGDGTGVFAESVEIPVTGGPSFIVATDMDQDGEVDLVTANESDSEASILWNVGGGVTDFAPATRVPVGLEPYSLLAIDFDGDDRPDIACVEEAGLDEPGQTGLTGGSVSVVLNKGRREFSPPDAFLTGSGPRFIVAGDMDGDGDIDLSSANRRAGDITVFLSEVSIATIPDYLESVCTPAEYFALSVQSRSTSATRRNGKYIVAARDDPSLHPALFQNVGRFRLHEDFLAEVFPDEFGFILGDPARYGEMIGRRATRDYFVGTVDLRQRDDGFLYTFNVVVDTGFDPREVLSQEETAELYDHLRTYFRLEPLAYAPNSQPALDEAETWVDPEFPVFVDNTPPPFQFEAYTLGLGYGRLRIMTLEEFEVANRAGRFTFQDGVVIEEVSPPDIEGVVGFVFTGGVQGELAHLPIRTARRGTPNAFVSNVREKFAEFEGELVRVEVFPENFFVTRVDASEAEEFWAQIRRELPEPPFLDLGHTPLDGFLEMDLTGRPVGRYGGKATNLGRLQRVILNDGTLDEFLEPGFGIPAHYYWEFMNSNFRGAQTYEEYIQEVVAREDVRTDSNLRFELLEEFRQFVRDEGVVDSGLVQSLALKIEPVFGDLATMVRFRSSSNVEDALVFNGAGLYESTSVCALDTLDSNERNSSFCDPARSSERLIERALRKVWSSLWTFRAHEERTFYQIDPNDSVMAVAVTRAFLNEDANGVAFTGSPRDVEDKRYVVSAQVGEGSVVSPPAGTTVERTLLEVGDGGVVDNVIRSRASNQVPPGVVVMSEEHLSELARFMWQIENAWEFDLPEDISREQVILDFEFKVEPDGSLAVKQVRPFLIPTPDLRAPTFELEIPAGTVLCGVFAPERVARPLEEADPQLEYEMKSQIRLRGGVYELPTDEGSFTHDLIEELRFGPQQDLAQPLGPGTFEFTTLPVEGSQTSYTFAYAQDFELPGGELFELKLIALEYVGRGSIALERRVVLTDHFNTFDLEMQASIDGTPRVAYSSCTYRELPRWELDLELQDGSRVSLVERFLAEESLIKTGRASVVEADVTIGDESQAVRDYWGLVYSSRRHNLDIVYWVVLEPELNVPGAQRPVRVVEVSGLDGLDQASYECPQAMVRYLDVDFAVIGTPVIASCLKETAVDLGPVFRRGDLGDGSVTIADAIQTLRYLFARGVPPSCLSSADANDDGRLDVRDAVDIVLHLFGGVSTLSPPFAECGTDPTPDGLTCAAFPACSGD